MQVSSKLQSKISKTKKKLSEDFFGISHAFVAFLCVFAIALIGFRITSAPISSDSVRGDIPVMVLPVQDRSHHVFEEKPDKLITGQTTAIVLDDEGNLFFGELSAFTKNYHDVRNKFVVKAVDGAPQVQTLLEQISAWQAERSRLKHIEPDGIATLLPSASIPMTVVIKVMADLRYSEVFERVVLASGLM